MVFRPALPNSLLGADDPAPVDAENLGAHGPFLIVCDHAGRAVPRRLGRLGLAEAVFETHIAWDIGAGELSGRLAGALNAGAIHQAYSRLVIDCNRAPGHPQSIAKVSDGIEIPGNVGLSPGEVAARTDAIHRPYHQTIATELDRRQARGDNTVLICVHSFTPVMGAVARPWHVGVLHRASPFCQALLALLAREAGLVVGDNEPYAMDDIDYTAPLHAWTRGLDVAELEVRQDLLQNPRQLDAIARVLIRLLPFALDH